MAGGGVERRGRPGSLGSDSNEYSTLRLSDSVPNGVRRVGNLDQRPSLTRSPSCQRAVQWHCQAEAALQVPARSVTVLMVKLRIDPSPRQQASGSVATATFGRRVSPGQTRMALSESGPVPGPTWQPSDQAWQA